MKTRCSSFRIRSIFADSDRSCSNSALKYYKGFVKQRSHDPRLRRQLARAYFRVGQITQEVESPNQAIEAYRQAQAIWEPLVAARPGDHELEGHLAASYLAVGKLQDLATNLDLDGAMKSLDRARAVLEPLAAANPLEPGYQSQPGRLLFRDRYRPGEAGTDRREPDPARESQSHRTRLDQPIPG